MGSNVIGHFGGYRKMFSFGWTCLIYHATTLFCARNYSYRNDPLGKTIGQMVGAARSARQNIVEASSRAATSKEQELRQLDVAKGSLDELAGDYEVFIIDHGEAPWSEKDERCQTVYKLALDRFSSTEDLDHNYGLYILSQRKKSEQWLENQDPLIAANSLLVSIRKVCKILLGQMRKTAEDFTEEGGFREHLTRARLEVRGSYSANKSKTGSSHACPICGKPMRKMVAKRGVNEGKEFWGCVGFPVCRGIRECSSDETNGRG